MNKTEVKLDYKVCKNTHSGVPVIVVAAGMSTRMQGINKQLMLVGDIPVLARTLLKFEHSDAISNIILVVKTEDIFEVQLLAEKYMIKKLSDIVCGGNTRQQSVLKGLARVDKSAEKVLIHDGARPLVDNTVISAVVESLDTYSAVTCGVKVKDTIKQINENGKVIATLNRDSLVAVQTPQGVRVKEYQEALNNVANVDTFTDDTSIMEAAGFDVYIVDGSYKNIKITTPEDIVIAEGYICGEEEE